jgi:hypothetical protein
MKFMHVVDIREIPSPLVFPFSYLISFGHIVVLVIYFFAITTIAFWILRWKHILFRPVILVVLWILPMWWIAYFTGINSCVEVPEIHTYLFYFSAVAILIGYVLNKARPLVPLSSKVITNTQTESTGPDISFYFK